MILTTQGGRRRPRRRQVDQVPLRDEMKTKEYKMNVPQKLLALRKRMADRRVAALVVPSSDPHQSEYVGARWQTRKWASGFTGSAGTLVITLKSAALWTDGRYFLQAEKELQGSGIRLFKSREPKVPTINDWIIAQLKPGQTVAFDGQVFSVSAVRDMEKAFAGKKLKLKTHEDLCDQVWTDRPLPSQAPAIDFPVKFAGIGRSRKLAAVRARLAEKGADACLLSSLDDIAWLFNIRGNDVEHSPVVLAYALVGMKEAILFAERSKFSMVLQATLKKQGVTLRPYESVGPALKALKKGKALCYNPQRVNSRLIDAIPKGVRRLEEPLDITTELKAIKNPVEQANWDTAARLDGLALVKFFVWLERELARGGRVTEFTARETLKEFRQAAPEYRDDSFNAICGYQANAAMIHYTVDRDSAAQLKPKGLFLVDSGGNYFEGTMDTTRTVALGPVSPAARRHYTLVLKGMIALSRVCFPAGLTGTHLDALARLPLWGDGVNYKHGSGHGVGAYLNVHEGPHGFTSVWSPSAFKPGMVVTIEPGFYREGKYGIRIENMALVAEAGNAGYGPFLRFDTLTLCPIDTAPLILALLTPEERAWLNAYHKTVWTRLSPELEGPALAWLKRKTRPV
ncbi:MAG: aminopeptidase P family protein [bacterium]